MHTASRALTLGNVCLFVYALIDLSPTVTSARVGLLVALGACGVRAVNAAHPRGPHNRLSPNSPVVVCPALALIALVLVRQERPVTALLLAAAVVIGVAYSAALSEAQRRCTKHRSATLVLAITLAWLTVSAVLFVGVVAGTDAVSSTVLLTFWVAVGTAAVVATGATARSQPIRLGATDCSPTMPAAVAIPVAQLTALVIGHLLLGDDSVGVLIGWALLTPAVMMAASNRLRSTHVVGVATIAAVITFAVEFLPYQAVAWLLGSNVTLAAPTMVLVALAVVGAAVLESCREHTGRDAAENAVDILPWTFLALTPAAALTAALTSRSATAFAISMVLTSLFCALLALLMSRTQAFRRPSAQDTVITAARRGGTTQPRSNLPLDSALRIARWRSPYDPLAGMAFLTLTAIILPAIVIGMTGPSPDANWLWPMPGVLLASLRLSWIIASRERRLFEAMFWIFSYAFLGLAAVAQLRDSLWPPTVPRMDSSLVVMACALILIANVAFLGGAVLERLQYRIRSELDLRHNIDFAGRAEMFTIDHSRLLLLTAVATVLNLYYLSKVGVIQFLESRDEAFATYERIWAPGSVGVMIRAASFMALLVALVALVRYRREAQAAAAAGAPEPIARLRLNAFLIFGIAVLTANSMNPISNARYQAGTAILSALAVMGFFATPRRYRLSMTAFLVALLVVFPFADAFRTSRSFTLKANNPVDSLASADYDSFAQIMNSMLIVSRTGVQFFHQLMGVPLFWVPRQLWPDKPVDTGIYLANQRGYNFTNLSAPWWGELYINGGWALLVIAMFALGYALHKWDTRIDQDLGTFGVPGILGSIYPFLLMIFLRGSLIQATPYFVFSAGCAFFVMKWRRGKARQVSTLPGRPAAATVREVTHAV